MANHLWTPEGTKIPLQKQAEHYASHARLAPYSIVLGALPDPDAILRKQGRGIEGLRDLLIDPHLESVWSVRLSGVQAPYQLILGDNSLQATRAADFVASQLKQWDVPAIASAMLHAVAFGYQPLELLWKQEGGYWLLANVVAKPSEWFAFDKDARLALRKNYVNLETLPDNRFAVVQYRPTYTNPYGCKLFSSIFWPVTLKRNGLRWWTEFLERYGSIFLYGKYPKNTPEADQAKLLDSLDSMLGNAVAVTNEDTSIEIIEGNSKTSSTAAHKEFIDTLNREISKAILGQTLTTQVDQTGSYAAAKTHQSVREDLAKADRRLVQQAFNRIFTLLTLYNFGNITPAPRFEYEKAEDLKKERSQRDKELYAIGWRPTEQYIQQQYNMRADDFTLADPTQASIPFTASLRTNTARHAIAATTDNEEEEQQSINTQEDFEASMYTQGQEALNKLVSHFRKAIEQAQSFDDAQAIILEQLPDAPLDELAHAIAEVRYAGSQLGADSAN